MPDRAGIIRPTPLFERLLKAAAKKLQPVLMIAIDTAADCIRRERERPQSGSAIYFPIASARHHRQFGGAAGVAPLAVRHQQRQRHQRLDRLE